VKSYLPYVIFGLTTGSIYGLAAMGLVLTYKTSGIFNFGHGAVGAVGAYAFYSFHQQLGLPWPVAAGLGIVVFGILLGLVLERLASVLADVSTFDRIVATVGLLLAIIAIATFAYGPEYRLFHPFLPQSVVVTLEGVEISYADLITLLIGVIAAIGLFAFFKTTRLGRSMRAVVDDPELLDMTGESPTRIRRNAWMIGSCFAAASGVLFASTQQQLDATLLSLLVVQAFGAAAIGWFTSLPVSFVGGLAVGVVQMLISSKITRFPVLQGLDFNVPFLALFVILLVARRRRLVEFGRQVKTAAGRAGELSPRIRAAGSVLTLAFGAVVPWIVGSYLPLWINALSQVVIFLSLAVLVRTSGQISLCQVGFAAVGAVAFAHAVDAGVPWLVAVLFAGLVAVPVGAIVSIPAIRLSGLFLGLATFGFGVFMADFFYTKSYMFGLGSLRTARPGILGLGTDTGYYYVLLAFAVCAIGLTVLLERSRLGRLLRGLADSPTALMTLATSANALRVIVFSFSAFLAGIGGALFAGEFNSVNGASFPWEQSLVLIAVLAISGRSSVRAAVLGSFLLFVVPGYANNSDVSSLLQIAFGIGAIVAAVVSSKRVRAGFAKRFGGSKERLVSPTADRLELVRRPLDTVGAQM
jgi:branched-subunit amino acid ABC-type transport system permease component